MNQQNTFYAIVQVIHNFGAVAVASCALLSLINPYNHSLQLQYKLAWITLIGWGIQGVSGASFGAVSFYYHGQFPDLHGMALAALFVKMICTAMGFILALFFIRSAKKWRESSRVLSWKIMVILFTTTLMAAAILRWFA
ncbi:MAG: hypothetical protein PHY93_14360 [Bacteriovorax sp.]|nr:hypothetical protein [Bacteriovorax sp.]